MSDSVEVKEKPVIFSLLKGSLFALIISIFAILIFAIILKFVDMSDIAIKVVNQIIKVCSILLGCLICLKKNGKFGLYKGTVVGLIYTVVAFLVFSLLGGGFSFNASIVYDLLFGGIFGGISGIIVVNSKNNAGTKI